MAASSELEDRGRRPFDTRRRRPWLLKHDDFGTDRHRALAFLFERNPFPGLRLSPPERLLGLAGHIAPRQSDIVQVPLGPMGQLIALTPAVKPDVHMAAEPGQNTRFMIICHISANTKGHVTLQNHKI